MRNFTSTPQKQPAAKVASSVMARIPFLKIFRDADSVARNGIDCAMREAAKRGLPQSHRVHRAGVSAAEVAIWWREQAPRRSGQGVYPGVFFVREAAKSGLPQSHRVHRAGASAAEVAIWWRGQAPRRLGQGVCTPGYFS